MVIDFHTHIFPPAVRKNRAHYLAQDPCFASLYAHDKAGLATAEDVIASMDKGGIDVSVALNIGWSSPELCRHTNDYIMESVARYPRRLIGFCMVQPNSPLEAVAEIKRCASGGIKGIGELRSDVQGFDLGDRATMVPVVEAAREYGMVILTHSSEPVGHSYPGKGKITPDVLCRFINNFPGIPLVCAHWGGGLPFYALMPEVAKSLSNVYFDTAATPYLYRNDIFRHVSELQGSNNILFGSDFPLMAQSRVVKVVRSLDLTEEVKGNILGQNAKILLGLR